VGRAEEDAERRRRLREQPVIAVEERGDAVVVRLGGELDLYNAPLLRETLLDACGRSPGRIVLDLSEVEFIDSTALGVVIEARASLESRRVLLASPAIDVRRALKVSGIDRHLPVHDSVESALAASS
jgi:anti-sigma B factor antagonist